MLDLFCWSVFQILKMLTFLSNVITISIQYVWCWEKERLQGSWGMSQNKSSIYIEMYWWKLLVKNTNWLYKQNVCFSVRHIYNICSLWLKSLVILIEEWRHIDQLNCSDAHWSNCEYQMTTVVVLDRLIDLMHSGMF